jgi:Mannosylglycerate hydrolase MGH1-like glycoside hydrolase domain
MASTAPAYRAPGPKPPDLCERPLVERLRGLSRATLERNWREGERGEVRYRYTAPSTGRYPWQWYWDSCFAAIAWRRFDRARARAELESLLAAAREDGFIGHTIFWGGRVTGLRSLFYNVRSRRDFMTGDPAAAVGVGLADRGRRSRAGAGDRATPRAGRARAIARR